MAIVRLCGAPATGKTWLGNLLAERLSIPFFDIADERLAFLEPGRWWPRSDATVWRALKRKVDAVPACIVETSGHSPNDAVLCRGRRALTLMVVASESVRAARLRARCASGDPVIKMQRDYFVRMLRIGPPPIVAAATIRTDALQPDAPGLTGLVDQCRRFVDGV